MNKKEIKALVEYALVEDIGTGDITAELISEDTRVAATIDSREEGVLCGVNFVNEAFAQLSPEITIHWEFVDSQYFTADQTLCYIDGPARSILTAERTAMNFLQTLSGTATRTHQFVSLLAKSNTQILDTRKTIPCLRSAQKYAVQCGGGTNHRFGLYDAYLIKENHIIAFDALTDLIHAARKLHPDKLLEIEVENLDDFEEALEAKPDVIMLDNFDFDMIARAVSLNDNAVKIEVSGGIRKKDIVKLAEIGVDYISVGALTKDIKAIDLSLRVLG